MGHTAVKLTVAPVKDFQGADVVTGEAKNFSFSNAAQGTVLMFLSTACLCSPEQILELQALASEFSQKGFSFRAVNLDTSHSNEERKSYYEKLKFPFAILLDEERHLTKAFQVQKTPHTFLISPSGQILYQGGVSDETHHFLKDALTALQEKKPIQVTYGKTLGCAVTDFGR